jgi:hypothetical protein
MNEGVDLTKIKMQTIGEGFGLTRKRELEISRVILKTISEFQKLGIFTKSDVIRNLKKLELKGDEYDFLLVMTTTYLDILEQKPKVVIVQEIKREGSISEEDKVMYV